jgi:molybdopterin converting factor subunit 1
MIIEELVSHKSAINLMYSTGIQAFTCIITCIHSIFGFTSGYMKLKILTFGITRDMVGASEISFNTEAKTLGELRVALESQYPEIKKLNSLFIAVNQTYVDDAHNISDQDELALIPPVSGG